MTVDQWVSTLGSGALFFAIAGILVFTALYGTRSNWRRYTEGRAVFWLAVSLSMLTLLVFWGLIDRLAGWDSGQGRNVFRAIAYLLVGVTSWRLVSAVWKSQRRDAREKRDRDRSDA